MIERPVFATAFRLVIDGKMGLRIPHCGLPGHDQWAVSTAELLRVSRQSHLTPAPSFRHGAVVLRPPRSWPISRNGAIPSRVACPFPGRTLMRLLALAMVFVALTVHAAGPQDAWCCPSTIAKTRQQASADDHAPGRPKEAAALATYGRLKLVLDAGCPYSTSVAAPPARSRSKDAIAYAWLFNDASAYLAAAGVGNDESQSPTAQPASTCRNRYWRYTPTHRIARNLGDAVAANVQQCGAPPFKPARIGIWSRLSQRFRGVHTASRPSV